MSLSSGGLAAERAAGEGRLHWTLRGAGLRSTRRARQTERIGDRSKVVV
jgi:hypothetical protein